MEKELQYVLVDIQERNQNKLQAKHVQDYMKIMEMMKNQKKSFMVCTNVHVRAKKKKKYFYTGCRNRLEVAEEVEIKKIDPKTGKNMKIKYYFNNDVKKLTDIENCPEYQLLFNYDIKDDVVAAHEGAQRSGDQAEIVKVVKKVGRKPKTATTKVTKVTKSTKVAKVQNKPKVAKTTTKVQRKAKSEPAKVESTVASTVAPTVTPSAVETAPKTKVSKAKVTVAAATTQTNATKQTKTIVKKDDSIKVKKSEAKVASTVAPKNTTKQTKSKTAKN